MRIGELILFIDDAVVIKTYMEDEGDLVVLQEFNLNDPFDFDKCELLYGKTKIDYCFIEDGKLTIVLL